MVNGDLIVALDSNGVNAEVTQNNAAEAASNLSLRSRVLFSSPAL